MCAAHPHSLKDLLHKPVATGVAHPLSVALVSLTLPSSTHRSVLLARPELAALEAALWPVRLTSGLQCKDDPTCTRSAQEGQ